MKTYCTATEPPHMVPVKPRKDSRHGISYAPQDLICKDHGTPLKTESQLQPRKPLRKVSEKREAEIDGRKYAQSGRRSSLKQRRGFAASPEQRRKIRNQPCIVCGQCSGFDIGEGGGSFVVDPAHLWPRGMGGCDSADCVIALCRAHHRAFDEGKLDILPTLISHGCWVELAHPILCHEVSPTQLTERLTGTRWEPVSEIGAAV